MKQYLICLVVFFAIFAILHTSQSAPTRREIHGINPQDKDFYRYAQEFRCRDGSKRIPFSSVNDDYCDCPDASDEPGTSACSPRGFFYCTNKGFKPNTIPSSRVNDNICDCCDGSDENMNRENPICPNTCSSESEKLNLLKRQEIERQIQGNQIKEILVADATALYEQKKIDLENLKIKHETLNKDVISYELKMDSLLHDKEMADEIRRLNPPKPIISGKNDNDDETENIPHESDPKDDNENEDDDEEEENYDEDEDEVQDEVKDEENDGNSSSGESEKVEEPSKFNPETLKEFELRLESEGKTVDSYLQEYESKKKELKSLKDDRHIIDGDIREIEDILESNFGENNEFFYLYGKTIEYKTSEYTYKLEPFKSIKQNRVNLGSFEKMTDKNTMFYGKGEQCWGGPKREMTVHMICGAKDEILKIEEPNRCQYSMQFTTPGACSSKSIEALEKEIIPIEIE